MELTLGVILAISRVEFANGILLLRHPVAVEGPSLLIICPHSHLLVNPQRKQLLLSLSPSSSSFIILLFRVHNQSAIVLITSAPPWDYNWKENRNGKDPSFQVYYFQMADNSWTRRSTLILSYPILFYSIIIMIMIYCLGAGSEATVQV